MSTGDELRRLGELYLPPADGFVLVDVPEMRFVVIEGEGDHSTEVFALGTRWLFSVIAPIEPIARERMGRSYVEPPLEVLWWADDMRDFIAGDRATWKWRQMIVVADWVDDEMFDTGWTTASERLGELPSTLRLDRFDEGTSAQIMHVGPEEDAIPTMARLYDEFLPEHHLVATGSLIRSVPRTLRPMARMTSTEAPPRWREVFAGARGRLTAGLLILEALVAVEIMVVATILPAVQEELQGLQLYGWNYAALTLASFGAVPIAGKLTDRLGPRRVLAVAIGFYVIGLVLAASAPSMLVLVVARFVQGIGGGGLYVVSLSTVAKTYPERIRPRVMALLASMWILPGLLGPPVGALLAETVGWRWAFLAPLPLIVLATAMVVPSLRNVSVREEGSKLPVAASLVLMVGAGSLLAGLTDLSMWSIPLVVVGTAVTIPTLRRITPPGTLTARAGLPAASAAAFLASAAFFAIDGFVPLMLTETRGLSIGEAGIVITASALAWAAGSWWQSRVVGRFGARRLTAAGALMIGAGAAVVAAGLLEVPLVVPYVGWAIGSAGMGIVFPTIPLSVMGSAEEGREAGELSSMILMDYLGVGIGAGLGGASVALADVGTLTIREGLAGAFGVGTLAAVLLMLVARRLPDARAG